MNYDSSADVKEIEKATLNLLHAENADIRQKRDPARYAVMILASFTQAWFIVGY